MSGGGEAKAPAFTATATIALAGNAFITQSNGSATEVINDNGLANWTSANTVTSTYFRLANTGTLTVAIEGKLSGSTSSTVRVSVNGTPFTVNLSGSQTKTYVAGTVNIGAPGYVKVDLQGISKSGGYFGDIANVKINGTAAASGVQFANIVADYYWSRRGPSVHMGYTLPANSEYFYNEVTVPAGEDKIGSYFMATGFDGGYAGIQVNSATERRVLFSVWDADNGAKTTLVSKGPGVVDNSFGGEGTGGQSYLVFPWVAGNTYKFITRARPDGAGNTLFSSWIYTPESASWRAIATWKRPATNTWYTGAYSFLENFNVDNGYMGRRVLFGNQWVRNSAGTWSEITAARFTGDATAANQQRLDFAGGVESGQFMLKNGGFFANTVAINQNFTRPAMGQQPAVNVSQLP